MGLPAETCTLALSQPSSASPCGVNVVIDVEHPPAEFHPAGRQGLERLEPAAGAGQILRIVGRDNFDRRGLPVRRSGGGRARRLRLDKNASPRQLLLRM